MIKAVTLDLDGTVYLGKAPVKGASEFIKFLRARGVKVLFVTNRANRLPATILQQLKDMGINCKEEDLLTSSQAAADYLNPKSAYIIGEDGLSSILRDHGCTITDDNPEYVIVSFDRAFSYDKLKTACMLIQRGAKFIATNPDQGLTTEGGIIPGTGSLVAAVEAGCRVKPQVIGKPEPYILEIAAKRMGVSPSSVLAIGDNVDTDIPSGLAAGMKTALILTGLSTREDLAASKLKPHYVAEDYSALTELIEPELYRAEQVLKT